MPFPDLPPERIPGSPEHLNDHQLIDQALDYIQQQAYRDDPDFPPLPDIPVLGQSGHVTAHDRILACLEYMKTHPATGMGWAQVSNNPTGTYKGSDGHTYAYVRFTSDGTLTVTSTGYVEALILAGGSGGRAGTWNAQGGSFIYGYQQLTAGSYGVVVGGPGQGGGKAEDAYGRPSKLGDLWTAASAIGNQDQWGGWNGAYAAGPVFDITGEPIEYARGSVRAAYARPNHGDGAGQGEANECTAGVVIVKTRLN